MSFTDEKILYRKVEKGAELLRLFSLCNDVVLPDTICGEKVIGIGDYAFAGEVSWNRINSHRKDILINGVGENPTVCTLELLSIEFSRTLEYIGDYAFYDCRNLSSITIYGNLIDVGGGAFMNCGKLSHITLKTKSGEHTCLNKLLSELTKKQYITFIFEDTEEKAVILMPEYFEESIENGPARIFEHFTRGSGFRYRQCINNGIIDFNEYDLCFKYAVIEESEELCSEIAILRLRYPIYLSDEAKAAYTEYLSENIKSILPRVSATGDFDSVICLCENLAPNAEALELAVHSARSAGYMEILGYIMNIKNEKFGIRKKRRFEF